MDLGSALPLRKRMDDSINETLSEVCTRIGMLMEDASTDALTISSMQPAEQVVVLERLGSTIDAMQALMMRARALKL